MKLNNKKGKSLARFYTGGGSKHSTNKWMQRQTSRAIRHLPIDYEIPDGAHYKKHWDRAWVTDYYGPLKSYYEESNILKYRDYLESNGYYLLKLHGIWYRVK